MELYRTKPCWAPRLSIPREEATGVILGARNPRLPPTCPFDTIILARTIETAFALSTTTSGLRDPFVYFFFYSFSFGYSHIHCHCH
jgi:hypothetical protein